MTLDHEDIMNELNGMADDDLNESDYDDYGNGALQDYDFEDYMDIEIGD